MKGYITKEQLSDNLKEYLQTLGLTQEQVNEAIKLSVGDKEKLQTNNKDSIVNAINEVFQSGVNVKNNMVQAINSKITVPDITAENTWNDIVSSVNNIKEAQGNAVAADVLSGKTFTNANGGLITGTMVDRGGAVTITPSTKNQSKAAGYYSGDITIKGDANLVASNIVSGKSIFGVNGTATASSLGGKRWASGTTADLGGTGSVSRVVPMSLSFTPSLIFVYSTNVNVGYTYNYGLNPCGTVFSNIGTYSVVIGNQLNVTITNISSSSFTINLSISSNGKGCIAGLKWYAFE